MPTELTSTDYADIARYRQYAKDAETKHDRVFWYNAAQRMQGKPTLPSVNYRQGRTDLKRNANPPQHAYHMLDWTDDNYAILTNPLPLPAEEAYAKRAADLVSDAKSCVGQWFYRIQPDLSSPRQMRVLVHMLQLGYTVQRKKVSERRRGVHEYKITQE